MGSSVDGARRGGDYGPPPARCAVSAQGNARLRPQVSAPRKLIRRWRCLDFGTRFSRPEVIAARGTGFAVRRASGFSNLGRGRHCRARRCLALRRGAPMP
eukprot:280430-Alexandrium_andersonii.AAC.1